MTLELTPPEIRTLILAVSTRMAYCDDRNPKNAELATLLDIQGRLHALLRPRGAE